jgi:hypothetical protein
MVYILCMQFVNRTQFAQIPFISAEFNVDSCVHTKQRNWNEDVLAFWYERQESTLNFADFKE